MSDILPSRRVNVGIIGCGNIFPTYVAGCRMFHKLNLKACADLNTELAGARAAEFGLEALSIDNLLADPSIEIVINLTIPRVHAQVSTSILQAGKHVYSEKPMALDPAEGRQVMALAREKNLRVGCAPDTFLGAGFQTVRKLIDDGWIGRRIGGTAHFMNPGPESWHPNPAFFYEKGGGPMFDMGPYHLTALVHLLGPVRSVTAMVSAARAERLATSPERNGQLLPVNVPTHYSGTLLFENGAIVQVGMSFDIQRHSHRPIEIYGTEGSVGAPDPNFFDGKVLIARAGEPWSEIALTHGYTENCRGMGVADMAHAIDSGRPHRCDGALALHVVDIMSAFEQSHRDRCWKDIESICDQPRALPLGLVKGLLDD